MPTTAARPDERSLLERARGGDADAFLALVEPYDRGLRALAFRLLGDADLMDEALQNAYYKAFRGIRSYRGRAAVSTWLYRIAYNACLDELRRQARARAATRDGDALTAAGGGDPADHVPGRLDLAAALGALPVDLRAVVLLADGEGFTYSQAAAVLGVPEGTVASRLARARALLRAALASTEEERS